MILCQSAIRSGLLTVILFSSIAILIINRLTADYTFQRLIVLIAKS